MARGISTSRVKTSTTLNQETSSQITVQKLGAILMTFKKVKHKGKHKQKIKYFLSNLKKYVRKYKGKKAQAVC